VSSWGTACGIADHLAQAKPAIEAADPSITIVPDPEGLDPKVVIERVRWSGANAYDWLWLNYHRALHSRWTPEVVADLVTFTQGQMRVLVTFHDTYGERKPDALQVQLHDLADAFVVHEPCLDLPKAHLIRQGVAPAQLPYEYYGWGQVPILGSVGWNQPWKNYDTLARVTGEQGWALVLCCNNATVEDEARWEALNPRLFVVRGFLPADLIVSYLAGCDATIFAYECANSGTSGAIRLGLAARKPVIAWRDCRQFRDLVAAELNAQVWPIHWCSGFDRLPQVLADIPVGRVDPSVVHLATLDSWVHQGQAYARLFQQAVAPAV
jgi:hypothetical protein